MPTKQECEDKLMPCPFCGTKARLILMPGTKCIYAVGCGSDILCPGYVWKCAPVYYTAEEAMCNWNKRAGNE